MNIEYFKKGGKILKKKGKITVTITIGIACLALSIVMFMQFKLVNETDITSIENMREEELRTELANWKEQYDEANEQYEQKSATLEEYKEKEESDAETENLVNEELANVNLILGKTDVEGEGITITLRDSSNDDGDALTITIDNLNTIINELKMAGAEAISVNEERIINMSDIASINDKSLILINGQRVISPYVIKAIGDSTYLESTLVGKGGSIDELEKLGYDVAVEKSNKITIYKYNKEINSKYMQ